MLKKHCGDALIKQHDEATHDASTKYDKCPALGIINIMIIIKILCKMHLKQIT